jgi:predicted transcriptional regulator
MSTTSLRIPDDLKDRIARAAERAGQTSNAFMLTAITDHGAAQERRADFHEVADQRYARLIESGETIPWGAMRDYLRRRLAGETPPRPRPVEHGDDS